MNHIPIKMREINWLIFLNNLTGIIQNQELLPEVFFNFMITDKNFEGLFFLD